MSSSSYWKMRQRYRWPTTLVTNVSLRFLTSSSRYCTNRTDFSSPSFYLSVFNCNSGNITIYVCWSKDRSEWPCGSWGVKASCSMLMSLPVIEVGTWERDGQESNSWPSVMPLHNTALKWECVRCLENVRKQFGFPGGCGICGTTFCSANVVTWITVETTVQKQNIFQPLSQCRRDQCNSRDYIPICPDAGWDISYFWHISLECDGIHDNRSLAGCGPWAGCCMSLMVGKNHGFFKKNLIFWFKSDF